MIDWLLLPHVFYPISICLLAIWLALFSRVVYVTNCRVAMFIGLAITLGSLVICLLFGLPLKEIPNAMIFKAGSLFGFRQTIALGYVFFLAGFILKIGDSVFQEPRNNKAPDS
jgi:hypothetical protein